MGSTLTTDNTPLEIRQMGREIERREQRLTGEKTHRHRNTQKGWDTLIGSLLVFHARANPDVRGPDPVRGNHREDVLWSLRQQQPDEPGSPMDQRPELLAFLINDRVILKHIGHATTED